MSISICLAYNDLQLILADDNGNLNINLQGKHININFILNPMQAKILAENTAIMTNKLPVSVKDENGNLETIFKK
ncbi:hypothetical protein [Pectinatus brassicae]|uniref:Uncharacterized protein n=1 Tax=Pectinatus brassicae TaxID=862415 RepID=A0A840UT35_9FIRM|nr:hypothetical protein [Pectinatus brassicae]MBB5336123.1 hypothetical protein [Pectinatus brassicae]